MLGVPRTARLTSLKRWAAREACASVVLQGGDEVRKPFDAGEMQLAARDQRFWESLLAATVTLTVVKVRLDCNNIQYQVWHKRIMLGHRVHVGCSCQYVPFENCHCQQSH